MKGTYIERLRIVVRVVAQEGVSIAVRGHFCKEYRWQFWGGTTSFAGGGTGSSWAASGALLKTT